MFDVATKDTWTNERTEMLRTLYANGLSSSQIACELGGGLSRNAIIGKVHRLGLGGDRRPRIRVCAPQKKVQAKIRSLKLRAPSNGGPVIIESVIYAPDLDLEAFNAAIPESQRCTILTISDEKCHWPVGDVGQPDFFFCGGGASDGPYCRYHHDVAHAAPPLRKDNSPAPSSYGAPWAGRI